MLLENGIYLAGLDVVEDKILEINITSPCFFVKEINTKFDIKIESIIIDILENLINVKTAYKNSKIN
jgi:glutathione synthase/RimK-type ligase-like ATP-grasp enzyme